MERLILDTTVLVAAERGRSALADALGDEDDVAVAAVTAAELLVGVELADGRRRGRRGDFVQAVLSDVRVEPYDLATAEVHARLLAHTRRSGRSRGAHDLLIAATALATGRTVVTTDDSGFDDLPGLRVLSLA
jgi:tRNA(fMet)-specific endonuclease VapC